MKSLWACLIGNESIDHTENSVGVPVYSFSSVLIVRKNSSFALRSHTSWVIVNNNNGNTKTIFIWNYLDIGSCTLGAANMYTTAQTIMVWHIQSLHMHNRHAHKQTVHKFMLNDKSVLIKICIIDSPSAFMFDVSKSSCINFSWAVSLEFPSLFA